MGYPGTIGLKTGDTEKAGRCLIAVVRRRRAHARGDRAAFADPQLQVSGCFAKAFRA